MSRLRGMRRGDDTPAHIIPPPVRILASAALASSLLAADVVLLTLFLNPEATLRRDGGALLASLFLPYAVAGTAVLGLLAALAGAFAGGASAPRRKRAMVEGLPAFGGMALLALIAAAALFAFNIFSYRHSMPLEFLRGLAVASAGLAGAALVLAVVALDARLFPHRSRGLPSALAVLAAASALVLPLALRPEPSAR